MDIVELGQIYMNDVKKMFEDKYQTSLDGVNSHMNIDACGKVIKVGISNFSINVQDLTSKEAIHYEFLKCLGEIGTYVRFSKADDGKIKVIHGRCIRDGQDVFAIMMESALLSDFAIPLAIDEIVDWPYPYFGITMEDTLNLLRRRTQFNMVSTDPEFAVKIPLNELVKTFEELSLISENKLSVEPSR